MPVFMRPDAEIHYEVHGSGYPLLLVAPGGLRSQIEFWRRSASNPDAPPPWMNPMVDLAGRFTVIGMEIQKDWRGPAHLHESIRRVTDFLTRNTPKS